MKRLLITCMLFAGISNVFAQSYCTIKKVHAYYNVTMPGMQMTDDNGNPIPVLPNITRFIYVEYAGSKMPEIKTVLYNNEALLFTVLGIKEKTVSIGDKNLNPNNTITAKKGNSFLKIDLNPPDGKTAADIDCKNIIIKYRSAGKICKSNLTLEKRFNTVPRY
jgi:hypothetical protein